jgi:hypothetical protein
MAAAAACGIRIPESLPLLEHGPSVRATEEAVERLLALNAVAAAAYGLERARAIAWLRQERLDGSLLPSELNFLVKNVGDRHSFQVQVEGMWSLAWALGMVPQLDFWKECESHFATMLPNLKTGQSGAEWRLKARMREVHDIVSACDLAYCLHWAIRQAGLDGVPPPAQLKPYVVTERRRALEWLLGKGPWDDVPLDT